MLVGILAANMSTLDAISVSYAALFIRNLYKPLVPDKSESHYLFIGRIAIGVTLLGGIGVAMFVDNLLELFKYIISVPAIFGASIWLGFIWRRLTKWAVIIQVVICIIIYTIIPNLFQTLDMITNNPTFTIETAPREVTVKIEALNEDVSADKADFVGQLIEKQHTIEPVGIFFDKVARTDTSDPSSQKVGIGRFHAEIWVLSWFGMDFFGYSKAQLVAARFFFSALFPFVLLFIISFLTKPVHKPSLDRFFAKMHTPVQQTPELDEIALAASYEHPEKFEKEKILTGSQWEILKPSRMDYIGFLGSWGLVGVVIFLLWIMVTIQ